MSDRSDEFSVCTVAVEAVRALRHRVLRPNEPPDSCIYPEDSTLPSTHFAMFDGGVIVSVASVYREDPPVNRSTGHQRAWRLRGMATTPALQRHGFGRRVLQAVLTFVTAQGGDSVWCNARTPATPFYEKAGFQRIGDSYDLPSIGAHYFLEWYPS